MLKKLSLIVVLFLLATSLFAADAIRRTVIVRDGKVVLDDDGMPTGKRAFLGVAMAELSPDLREFFGAPKDAGVLVSSLVNDGPAVKAGLRVGDVITGINGKTVASSWDLAEAMKDKHSGDSVRLDIVRAKGRQTIVATAEERDMPELGLLREKAGMKMLRAIDLGALERDLGTITGPEWRARLATPETEELRRRIRDLEKRLQELEKRLQK